MPYIKINNEKMTKQDAEFIAKICPFHALECNDEKLEVTAACKMCGLCLKKAPSGFVELVEEEKKDIVDKNLWSGVSVVVEFQNGKLHPVSLELLGKARELADKIGHRVIALAIGFGVKSVSEELIQKGADQVYCYDHKELEHFRVVPYTAVAEKFIKEVSPAVVLIGATVIGRTFAPRIASRFGTGLTADCTQLEIRDNTDLVQIRPAFGGNIMAQIVTECHRPQMATVRYKVFNQIPEGDERHGEIKICTIDDDMLKCQSEVLKSEQRPKETDIAEADVIVAVGRAFRTKEDIELARKLADAVHAQLACTRPLVENGLFDPRRQIGLSGRTVKPKLIIACGISGAVQFTAGMKGADCIIAINKDESAPIFAVADYGLVGDVYSIIPRLLEKLDKKHK